METQELPPATDPSPETWGASTQSALMVYDAIRGVSLELSHEGISKERSNQQQGYKFRGIDDCLNALSGLLPKYGLIITPHVEARDCVERQTKSGGSLFYVTVRVRFSFISTIDGSRHDAVLYGEAMDSADKATNKAMSAAYKYCVLLTFCIPTEAEDADSVTHEVLPTTKNFAQKFPEQAKKIEEKLRQGDGLKDVAVPPRAMPLEAPVSQDAPASLLPGLNAGSYVLQFPKELKGQMIGDVTEVQLNWLAKYYNEKLSAPANAQSPYRQEWEGILKEVWAEQLRRDKK